MHYKMLQPSALNKLNKEMIFNNRKGKVLQKLFLLNNILFKRIFCIIFFDILELNTFGLFLQVVFSIHVKDTKKIKTKAKKKV
jgi:hypothetical protein